MTSGRILYSFKLGDTVEAGLKQHLSVADPLCLDTRLRASSATWTSLFRKVSAYLPTSVLPVMCPSLWFLCLGLPFVAPASNVHVAGIVVAIAILAKFVLFTRSARLISHSLFDQ